VRPASPPAPFRYRWYARGDVNGFFALATDNMALLVAMSGILVGVFHLPADIVLGRMVPGTALGVLVGDLLYSWLAFRLARKERRHDVCAMPLGIDTPSTFALCFGVVGPAYVATRDAHQAWAVGMAVMVIMGVAKLAAAFAGDAVRRMLPRTALLGALGAVAVGLIMFFPFLKIVAEPVGGIIALGIVLITLIGKVEMPGRMPAVVVSVIAGYACYTIAQLLGYVPPPMPVAMPPAGMALPLPSFTFVDGLAMALHYLPLAIPVALATVIGGIDNTASAAVAGDEYATRDILLVEGGATLLAALCGGVIQNTPYIGHPAYKEMGSRAGYTVATGLFIGVGAAAGLIGALIALLPESIVVPVLVFVGLEMAEQATVSARRVHVKAVALASIPVIAYLVHIQLGTLIGAAHIEVSALPAETQRGLLAVTMLGNGFIVTAMLWATWLIFVIEHDLAKAAWVCASAAALTAVGLMHSPHPDGSFFFPGQPGVPPLAYALAAGYALLGFTCALFARRPRPMRDGHRPGAPPAKPES
jgi:AGZA family xanthine/uracil permease-like MFS transporter